MGMENGAVVAASGLEKSYTSDSVRLDILRGLDLETRPGELIGITGASGTGKSTLLHILGGLDKPNAGTVTINGQNLFALDDNRRSQYRGSTIGFVFQFHHLLPEFTALENVIIPAMIAKGDLKVARKKAEGLFSSVGLLKRMSHRPGKLSGGEQQRVAIIRALMNNPRVLLADEPTGNLDENTAEEVFLLIKGLVKEKNLASIIVTHNMKLVGLMDRVYELHEGRLHGRGG